MNERPQSPAVRRYDVTKLVCYGCAHSASGAEHPGKPSGERPCCFCIRNPEREQWAAQETRPPDDAKPVEVIVFDAAGAELGTDIRTFDPFIGRFYNGEESVYLPMDNYVTLDQRDQEYARHRGKFPTESYIRFKS